jgi:hypothetical protein
VRHTINSRSDRCAWTCGVSGFTAMLNLLSQPPSPNTLHPLSHPFDR